MGDNKTFLEGVGRGEAKGVFPQISPKSEILVSLF
jgi:hypothetical protein